MDEFGDFTFGLVNFHEGVGTASPVIDPKGAMYDLNVLTVRECVGVVGLETLLIERVWGHHHQDGYFSLPSPSP